MPAIMSQNVIAPDRIKPKGPFSSGTQLPTPHASIESQRYHYDHSYTENNISSSNGYIRPIGNAIMTGSIPATDEDQSVLITTSSTAPSRRQRKTPSLPLIQAPSFRNKRGRKSKSTSSGSASLSVSAPSPSSLSTMETPLGHIRKWTSALSSSSKKQQDISSSPKSRSKSSRKSRAIGPISAPQPLIAPAPYACTPLPYSGALDTTEPATSYLALPTNPQALHMPTDSSNPSNYSSLSKNYRTTWKGRLFYPTGNEQDRQTSTNSNTEDVNEWSSQESDVDAYNPVATDRTEHRATIHNSSPLAQTILPSYREDITIDLAALMSPIDDAQFGLDSFGPFNITPKNKAGESTSVQATPTTAQSMLDILSATNAEDTSQCHQREQYDIYCNMDGKPEQKAGTEQGNISNSLESDVHDSTASPCERLESDLNTFESRTWTKGKDDSEQRTIWRRHIRASSTSSDSSTSSTSSTESFSSDSSDSSQTSPISGVSFFSSPPKTFAAATIESSTSSETALSTNTIKVPSSMMTMLPASNRREKETSYSFSTTSPVAPPSENPGSERTDTGFTRPSLPATGTTHANPKALMLKRMAYIHTLKKLRERERRPFQHAVLLQLVLLQLRQGITNNQCEEIGDFYTSMWTAHFPAKWGVSSLTAPGQCQSYVQQTLLQGLQRGQSENGLNQAKTTAPQSSKDAKTKRSFISSIQSRIQFSKASNGASVSSSVSSNVMEPVSDSGATSTSPAYYLSPPLASSCVNRANSTAFKDRFPLLRTPPYPLINLDEKDPFPLAPASHRTVSATTVSGGAPSICVGYGVDKDGQADLDQHEAVRPSPTIIIPKRTTGRKGLLYLQQQQFQMQLQRQLQRRLETSTILLASNECPGHQNLMAKEQDQAPLLAQLLGTRPRFATSTYTTVFSEDFGLVTKPLAEQSMKEPEVHPDTQVDGSWTFHLSTATLATGSSWSAPPSHNIHSAATHGHLSMFPAFSADGSTGPIRQSLTRSPPFHSSFANTSVSVPVPVPVSCLPIRGPRLLQACDYIRPSTSRVSLSASMHSPSLAHAQTTQHTAGYFADNQAFPARKASNSRANLDAIRQCTTQPGNIQGATAQPVLSTPQLPCMMDSDAKTFIEPSMERGFRSHQARENKTESSTWLNRSLQRLRSRRSMDGARDRASSRNAHGLQARHSMDDDRRSAQEKQGIVKDGQVEEEEDVPLAFVRRRISSEMQWSAI